MNITRDKDRKAMNTKIEYGWGEEGNCLFCGKGGICKCDHTIFVTDPSKLQNAAPDLLAALKSIVTSIDGSGLSAKADDVKIAIPAEVLKHARRAVSKAEGK